MFVVFAYLGYVWWGAGWCVQGQGLEWNGMHGIISCLAEIFVHACDISQLNCKQTFGAIWRMRPGFSDHVHTTFILPSGNLT